MFRGVAADVAHVQSMQNLSLIARTMLASKSISINQIAEKTSLTPTYVNYQMTYIRNGFFKSRTHHLSYPTYTGENAYEKKYRIQPKGR